MVINTHSHASLIIHILYFLYITLLYVILGVPPKESSFLINALLLHHYKRGAYYPQGGASEFAFHIIPVIHQAGGAVLVRAPVQRILLNQQGKAYGERGRERDRICDVILCILQANVSHFFCLLKTDVKSLLSQVKSKAFLPNQFHKITQLLNISLYNLY